MSYPPPHTGKPASVAETTAPSPAKSELRRLARGSGWNGAVIFIGLATAAIALVRAAGTEAESAVQQSVTALSALQGAIGMLIAAVGIAAGTIYWSDTPVERAATP